MDTENTPTGEGEAPAAITCFVCDGQIQMAASGHAQLPCGHMCHLRCLTAGIHNFYEDDLQMRCRGCFLNNIKTEIPPSGTSVDDAHDLIRNKIHEKKQQNVISDISIDDLIDFEVEDIKEYCKLTKQCLKQEKVINKITNSMAKEFKKEVEPIVYSINKIYRKYYLKLRKLESNKLFIRMARKHRDLFDRMHEISAKYSETFNTRIDTDKLIKLVEKNPGYFSSNLIHINSFKYKFRLDKMLYNTKGVFKK